MKNRIRTVSILLAIAVACQAGVISAADKGRPAVLPKPDTKAPDTTKPIKVFILMGQSNMVGFGRIDPDTTKGTLAHLTKKENKYPHVIDGQGNWAVRNDVWCVQVDAGSRKGWLQPGFGARASSFGPELGFGHVMGHVHDETVLIIKATMGNRCLGWDILPPSSYTPEHIKERKEHTRPWYPGWEYDKFVNLSKDVLAKLPKYFPSYKNQGYEIVGFGWWQGHKDQKKEWAEAYEKNLVNLIKDLRKDFNAPDAKFVLATIAFGGWDLKGAGLTVANAQLAVSGEKGKYPEFKGNVKTVEARDFWRGKSVPPSGQGYHYNHNAETYMEVGNALGWAMAELLKKNVPPRK